MSASKQWTRLLFMMSYLSTLNCSFNLIYLTIMDDRTPQQIRDEFASLWEDQVIGKEYLLRALSNYVSTDTLAEFMDDLANERV
jgi:hypothetical protein